MPKSIPLSDKIEVDNTDLSDYCNHWTPGSAHSPVDVSGFNATGTDEFLLGPRASSMTAEFFPADEVHDVLWPAHINRSIITVIGRNNMNAATSATNPEFRGHCYVQDYNPDRSRGNATPFTVTFLAADAAGFQWYDAVS